MKKILVLCTGNSCRSQIAEGYLKQFAGDKAAVYSAGVETHGVNARAIEIMKEDGIDISNNPTNDVFSYFREGKMFNYVITVCDKSASDRCPVFPGMKDKINWSFEDPSQFSGTTEEKLQKTRVVRDKIKSAVLQFIQTVTDKEE